MHADGRIDLQINALGITDLERFTLLTNATNRHCAGKPRRGQSVFPVPPNEESVRQAATGTDILRLFLLLQLPLVESELLITRAAMQRWLGHGSDTLAFVVPIRTLQQTKLARSSTSVAGVSANVQVKKEDFGICRFSKSLDLVV